MEHYGRKQSANPKNNNCTAVFFVMVCCLRLANDLKPVKHCLERKIVHVTGKQELSLLAGLDSQMPYCIE
jgi:hypothetical protein